MINYRDYRIFYKGKEITTIFELEEAKNFFGKNYLHVKFLQDKQIHDLLLDFKDLEFEPKINLKLSDSELYDIYKEVKERYSFINIDDKKIIAYLEHENRTYRNQIKNLTILLEQEQTNSKEK